MGFKQITVVTFNDSNETELKMDAKVKIDKRDFTREVAAEYLKMLKINTLKRTIFIRVAKNGHLFVRET